jgi:uncharacterized membrane protein
MLTALLAAALSRREEAEEWEVSRKRRMRALWGCAAGTGAALVLVILRRTTALINRGFFNLWILSFAIVSGILYLFFMWGGNPRRSVFKKRPALSAAVPDYIQAVLLAALLFYALPTIFLYPTEFVLAGESVFSTDFLFKFIGFAGGLAVVSLTGFALYKTGRAIPELFLKIVITIAVLVNVFSQAVVIVQFLLARRIIRMIRWLFRFIAAVVNNNIVFLYVFIVLGLLLTLAVFIKSFKPLPACNNPAERRKLRFSRRVNRRMCLVVAAGCALSVVLLTSVKSYMAQGVVLSPAESMTLAGNEILIPITQVEDGRLHRFVYTASDGIEVRFIVIKKNAAAYGVGLDACDICGPTGYYERKGQVICRLCDVVMNISTIGFKGGCNPVPLAYTMRSGSMIIDTENLENERARFK